MKIRNGFVSNSSSSSFVIPKKFVSEIALDKLYNHIEEAKKHNIYYDFGWMEDEDRWSIYEEDDYIEGSTHMDNFNMYKFLVEYLNIPKDVIKWEE